MYWIDRKQGQWTRAALFLCNECGFDIRKSPVIQSFNSQEITKWGNDEFFQMLASIVFTKKLEMGGKKSDAHCYCHFTFNLSVIVSWNEAIYMIIMCCYDSVCHLHYVTFQIFPFECLEQKLLPLLLYWQLPAVWVPCKNTSFGLSSVKIINSLPIKGDLRPI